jgi:transcriptional regulator with XRE-family HTH domain
MSTMLSGSKLRAIRSLKGMTQAQLAEASGVSPTAITEYEKGKRDLRADTIRKLCEALGVQVKYIVDGTEITGP